MTKTPRYLAAMKIFALRFILSLCCVFLGEFQAFAQGSSLQGLPPFATYAKFGPVTVNLTTLTNHIEFPLVNKPGRSLPINQFAIFEGYPDPGFDDSDGIHTYWAVNN